MIYSKQSPSTTEVFHFKTPRKGFSFLPPVSFEIIQCRFFWSDFYLSDFQLAIDSSLSFVKREMPVEALCL